MIDTHVSKVVTSGKEGGKWDQGGEQRSFNFFFFLAKIYRLSEILKSEIQVGAKVVE